MIPFVCRILLASCAMLVAILETHWILDHVLATANNVANQSLSFRGIVLTLVNVCITIAVGCIVYLRISRMLKLLNNESLAPIQRLRVRLRLAWL